MGSANVQVLREMEECFNRRDLDGYAASLDPSVEWHVSREDPDTTVHHGRVAVRAYLQSWIDAFGDLRLHMEDVEGADERVETVIRFVGKGTGSGVPLDGRATFVWTFRDGRVTKVEDRGRDQASTK
jgi:ketosteroid isomerase-like protein